MNKFLEKQLRKLNYKDGVFPKNNLEKFIKLVDEAYNESDEERSFLEHTLETSSEEMNEIYEELKQKSQSKLAISEQKYKDLARKDTLTGLLNRFAFQEELKKTISNAKRTNVKFALLFLDLDHFKNINDTYGHDIGDKLLKEVATRILPNIRIEDLFARIGGDEFVLVLTNISKSILNDLVEKTIELFRQEWTVNKIKLNITTSIGVSIFPDDAITQVQLMKKADIAMYKSKELGRNKIVYFDKKYFEVAPDAGFEPATK